MKHAILLISSYGIEYLNHFIEQFNDCSDYDFYIHIDNKTYKEYQDINNPNIKFIDHLYNCPRYSKNLVLIMFKLLQLSQKNNYDYYHFFSDHCYFIQSSNVFFEKLNNSNNKSYLTYYLSNNFYNDKQLYKSTQWMSLHKNIVNQLINYESLINKYLNAYDNKQIIINDGALDEIIIQNIIFENILQNDFSTIENNSYRYMDFEFGDSTKVLTFNEIHKYNLEYIYNNFYILRKIDYNNPNSIKFLETVQNYNNQKEFDNLKYNEYCNLWCAYHTNQFLDQYNLHNTNNFTLYNTNNIDLTQNNINYLSKNLGEFVMYYYIWKNQLKSNYIGLCHYRRHFNYINFDLIDNNTIQVFKNTNTDNKNYIQYLINNGFNTYIIYSFIQYLKDKKNIDINKFSLDYQNLTLYSSIICTWEIFNDICEVLFGFLNTIIINWKDQDILYNFTNNMYQLYKDIVKYYSLDNIWDCNSIRYITWWETEKQDIIQYRFLAIMFEFLLGIYININYNTFYDDHQYNLIVQLDNIDNIDKIYTFYKKNLKYGFANMYILYNGDLWINSYEYQQLYHIKSIHEIKNAFKNKWIKI